MCINVDRLIILNKIPYSWVSGFFLLLGGFSSVSSRSQSVNMGHTTVLKCRKFKKPNRGKKTISYKHRINKKHDSLKLCIYSFMCLHLSKYIICHIIIHLQSTPIRNQSHTKIKIPYRGRATAQGRT